MAVSFEYLEPLKQLKQLKQLEKTLNWDRNGTVLYWMTFIKLSGEINSAAQTLLHVSMAISIQLAAVRRCHKCHVWFDSNIFDWLFHKVDVFSCELSPVILLFEILKLFLRILMIHIAIMCVSSQLINIIPVFFLFRFLKLLTVRIMGKVF